MWCDMGLDINQTKTYHEHASNDPNSTYARWALNHQNITNSTYLEKVSSTYFYVAVSAWVLPPLLVSLRFMLLNYVKEGAHDLIMINVLLYHYTGRRT